MKLSNKAYDVAKSVAQIWLPALATAYFSLAQIWGLPQAEEVVGTITIIDAFLGGILKLSSSTYNNADTVGGKYDGKIVVQNTTMGSTRYTLELNENPVALQTQQEALFKIEPADPAAAKVEPYPEGRIDPADER